MKEFKIYKSRRWGGENVSWAHFAVKNGFSWPALLIAPIWTLSKGLWGYAAPLYILAVGSRLGDDVAVYTNSSGALNLSWFLYAALACISIYLGFRGNQLWSAKLERDDYKLLKTVEAKSSKAALAPYKKDY